MPGLLGANVISYSNNGRRVRAPTFAGTLDALALPEATPCDKAAILAAFQRENAAYRDWQARGPRILELILEARPSVVALQEYDIHTIRAW